MIPVWRPPHLTRFQMEQRRLEGQRLLNDGTHTSTQIAQALGVHDSTVWHWVKKLRRNGPHALQATIGGGQAKRLTDDQEVRLCHLLDLGAVSYGFPNEQWTSRRVRELIGQQFGVWYHVDHVYKLLVRLGYSAQKPEKRSVERNEEAIQTWVKTRAVELGKKDGWRHDVGVSR